MSTYINGWRYDDVINARVTDLVNMVLLSKYGLHKYERKEEEEASKRLIARSFCCSVMYCTVYSVWKKKKTFHPANSRPELNEAMPIGKAINMMMMMMMMINNQASSPVCLPSSHPPPTPCFSAVHPAQGNANPNGFPPPPC